MNERDVVSRVLAGLDDLVADLGRAYRAEVDEYASLDASDMEREVLPVSRSIVRTFFTALAAGRDADIAAVPDLDTMGHRRLEMGVPLEPMLHVYRVAGRVVWEAIVSSVGDGGAEVLGQVGGRWIDFIDRASSVAAAGYLDASHERLRHLDARRDALLEALLAADDDTDVAAVAAEYSVSLADVFVPVVVGGPDVAARIDQSRGVAPPGSIVGQRGETAVLLLPAHHLADTVADLARALDAPVVAHGVASPAGPLLAAETRHAERVLGAAQRYGRSGVFGPDDLVVEQVLSLDTRAPATLERTILDPLRAADRTGVIVETLASFLASGSIPASADELVVHPNTVAYRLRRVQEVTGRDPRVPADAALLHLAMVHAGQPRS